MKGKKEKGVYLQAITVKDIKYALFQKQQQIQLLIKLVVNRGKEF